MYIESWSDDYNGYKEIATGSFDAVLLGCICRLDNIVNDYIFIILARRGLYNDDAEYYCYKKSAEMGSLELLTIQLNDLPEDVIETDIDMEKIMKELDSLIGFCKRRN